MPLVLAFVVLAALVYGAVALYMTAAERFGWLAGVGADLLAVALIAAVIALVVRRYRTMHGRTVDGKRVLTLEGAWGAVQLDAIQKRGSLSVGTRQARFIFTDIASARAQCVDGNWTLALRLDHNPQGDWTIPLRDRRQAQRWAKIFTLAAEQNL